MAIRGIYTDEEKKMIADFEEMPFFVGWMGDEPSVECTYPVGNRVASIEAIKTMARALDPWNPLWSDDNYAKRTRWGGIIAPPLFQNCITAGGSASAFVQPPEDTGAPSLIGARFAGEDWDMFQPIRANDSFHVWCSRPQLIDLTSLDGRGPRKFRVVVSDVRYYNQKDELVSTVKRYFDATIAPERKRKKVKIVPDYRYTNEEMAYIDRIANEEEIRGAKIRYWEDVSVGDEIRPPVILELTTPWDQARMAAIFFGSALIPMREVRKKTPNVVVVDPITGVTHKSIEIYLSNRVMQMTMGEPIANVVSGGLEQLQCRLITNWMGDDGFIKKYYWRMFDHVDVGNSIISRGKVIKKYVKNGEHLVDISVWAETFRGNIPNAALITVRLVSK